jgi:hypothetical protein
MLVEVVSCIMWLPIVDEVLLDRCHLLASRRRFLVDRNLLLMSCWLVALFHGHPSTSRC